MKQTGNDDDEKRRLRALRRLEVLDTAAEPEFDALVRAAALVCDVPISLVSLIDEDRQWFKANVGLEGVGETRRELAFCAHAIKGDDMMEVEDARQDPRFSDNPLVTGEPNVRFYAGVPLKLTSGENIGTLCVIDQRSKTLSDKQRHILEQLAEAAVRALEVRRAALHERELQALASQAQSALDNSVDAIVSIDMDGHIHQWNKAAERMFGYTAAEVRGQALSLIASSEWADEVMDIEARLAQSASGPSGHSERVVRGGARLPVSVSIGPVRSRDGEIIGATEIIRDISDIVKTNAELAEAGQRFRRLYKATPAMLHSAGPDGLLLSVSDHWLEVMDYQRQDVLGRSLTFFMTKVSAARITNEVMPAFLRAGRYDKVHCHMVTRTGNVLDVLLSAVLEYDGNGAPLRMIGTVEDVTRRFKAEKALSDERHRLEQIIASTGAGTWEWNVATGELRCNAQWAAIIGRTLEDLLPLNADDCERFLHPDDLEIGRSRLASYLSGESAVYECEMRMRHKDGYWLWVISRGRLVSWTDDGQPEWMFGLNLDISRRKHDEEERRKSEEFLEQVGRVTGIGGWQVDLLSGAIFWSNETCRIHGVEAGFQPDLEQAIGFYAPESRPVIESAVKHCIATGEGWDLELSLVRADGTSVWVRVVGSAHYDDGEPVRLVGAFQDINEHVEQRKALEAINARIAIATENGRIGIWDANLETGKTYYSDIWCGLLGYCREEVSDDGMLWLSLTHPDDKDLARLADAAHMRGEKPFFEEQFRMRHKDGHWIWILDRGRIVARDADGKPTRMIGTHTDITRQKEEELERLLMGERMAIAADSGGIGIWEIDLETEIVSWDSWMYRIYGMTENSALDILDIWRKYAHPADVERVEAAILLAIENILPLEEEYRIVWDDGSVHHVHFSARMVLDEHGSKARLIGAAWDVTEERELALELAEQYELLSVTLNSIGDAVITTDADGLVQWLNPAAVDITGWSVEEAQGKPSGMVFRIFHEADGSLVDDPVRRCLELKEIVDLPDDTVLKARDGRLFGIADSAAPIRSSSGEVHGAVLVFHDVSEQRRLSQEMSYRANHDPLTGLINRAEFERRLTAVYKRSKSENSRHALLYIDLDRFKIVNDTCGHTVGDELLKKIASLMQETVRAGDTLARLGGDEFAVILEHCSVESARMVAETLCEKVSIYRFVHGDRQFRVGASIGLVPVDKNSASVAGVLQAADSSCYVAKDEGRNRVHVWHENDAALNNRAGETRWASRLEEALDADHFILYAQKISPVSNPDRTTHIELLLRLKEDDGRVIMPATFMPAAERFNLMSAIDRWVLSRALEWIAAGDLGSVEKVSVNLSGQSVGDRDFHKFALNKLRAVGPDVCHRLCLEITETAVITNLGEALDFIGNVHSQGVSVALDDFGAGSSSFGYLKKLPVDYLKIDGQFIQGLTEPSIDEATVRCFVEVAKVLGIRTVAEFVSDEKLIARLAELGVDLAQGFYLHEPEPLDTLSLSPINTA